MTTGIQTRTTTTASTTPPIADGQEIILPSQAVHRTTATTRAAYDPGIRQPSPARERLLGPAWPTRQHHHPAAPGRSAGGDQS